MSRLRIGIFAGGRSAEHEVSVSSADSVLRAIDRDRYEPFLLAGVLGPGGSQLLFTLAVRDAGPSRTSVTVGTAPLFSVAIALALLDEPAKAGVLVGAILIVVGGILLVGISIGSLLELKPIRTGNLLPALVASPAIVWILQWIGPG